MSALLQNKELWERATPLTIEAYHLLYKEGLIPEKTELLEGVVIQKMPKDPIHAELVTNLTFYLYEQLKNKFQIRQENPIGAEFSLPEPDIAIVPIDDYSKSHPKSALVVIEVANSSLQIDRAKSSIYAKIGVPEYIIVNLQNLILEYYSSLSGEKYSFTEILQKNETFTSTTIPEISFRLEDFLK